MLNRYFHNSLICNSKIIFLFWLPVKNLVKTVQDELKRSLPRWSSLCRVNYPRMTHHFSTHVFRTNNVRWINSFDTNFSSKWLINETFVRSPGEKREIVFTLISTLVMHVEMRGFRAVRIIEFPERFFTTILWNAFFRSVTTFFCKDFKTFFQKIFFSDYWKCTLELSFPIPAVLLLNNLSETP